MVISNLDLIEKEIKQNILIKDNLVSILLFGSAVDFVRTAGDYDILIITKKRIQRNWIVAGTIKNNLLGKVDKPVDIVFLEENDLKFSSPFLYEISHKSKLIYGQDISKQLEAVNENICPLIMEGSQIGWQVT